MTETRQIAKPLEADHARKLLSDTHSELKNPHGRNMELVFNHLGVLSRGGILDNPTVRSYFRTVKKRGLNLSSEERISVTQRLEQQLSAGYYDQFLTDILSGRLLGIDLSEVISARRGLVGQSNEAALASKLALRIVERNKARDGEAVVLLIAMFDQLGVQPPAPIAPLLPEFLKRYKDANNEFKKEQKRQAKLQSPPPPKPQVETRTDGVNPQQGSLAGQQLGRRKFFTRAFGAGIAGIAEASSITRGVATTAAGLGAGAIAAKAADDRASEQFYKRLTLSEKSNRAIIEALRPLFSQAMMVREARGKDPEVVQRIDPELNKNRVNFLLVGIGSERDMQLTDTIMMVSYSLIDNSLDLVSIPRDLHAPEIDRHLIAAGQNPGVFAINVAYSAGGFGLERKVIEDATGLYVDYITKFRNDALSKVVEKTLGSLELDVKEDVYEPEWVPGGRTFEVKKGKRRLSSDDVYKFIVSRRTSGDVDRAGRAQQVVGAIIDSFKAKLTDKNTSLASKTSFVVDILNCIKELNDTKLMENDSDILGIVLNNILAEPKALQIFSEDNDGKMPSMRASVIDFTNGLYYADPERLSKRQHLLTVEGGDYKAQDLVTGYWARIRAVIEGFLTKKNGVAVNQEE